MNNQSSANNQLLDVAQRIREMRQIIGYTAEQMAAQILKLLEARHRSRQREER